MKLDVNHQNDVTVIKPHLRRIDASVATELKSRLIDLVDKGNEKIVINLSEVDFIDSSGLGVLVLILRRLGPDGKIRLCKVNDGVRSIFELTRLNEVFVIHKTVEGAVEGLLAA
ncbi:STAS domain-containing protein [Acidobacteriota bacterium]